MSLGAFALAGCGGADEPEDTTPASNENDGFKAGVGAGVEAGDTEVEAGAGVQADEDGASVGGEVEAGEPDKGNEGMEGQPEGSPPDQQQQPEPQPQDPSQPHPMPQPSPQPAPTPTPTP